MHINRQATQKMINIFKEIAGNNDVDVSWIQESDLKDARRDIVDMVCKSVSQGRNVSMTMTARRNVL